MQQCFVLIEVRMIYVLRTCISIQLPYHCIYHRDTVCDYACLIASRWFCSVSSDAVVMTTVNQTTVEQATVMQQVHRIVDDIFIEQAHETD